MSKKSFVIILGLSVGVWIFSAVIHAVKVLYIDGNIGYSFFGSSCSLTGYPLAKCVNNYENPAIYYLLNVSFWFALIWFFARRFRKLSKSKK